MNKIRIARELIKIARLLSGYVESRPSVYLFPKDTTKKMIHRVYHAYFKRGDKKTADEFLRIARKTKSMLQLLDVIGMYVHVANPPHGIKSENDLKQERNIEVGA